MSTETVGWILVAAPFVLIWLVAFFIDPFASFVILFASAAAGVMAGVVAYGLMLTGAGFAVSLVLMWLISPWVTR